MYTVYKHINKNGDIIYIGKSKNLKQRQQQHKKTTEWFNDIDEIEYMEFETKTGMDIAELYLINKYSPINNKKDNRGEDVNYMTINENWKGFDMSNLLINRSRKLGNTSLDNCYKKLNQLIHIDRVGMSAIMIDLMDRMLYKTQLIINEKRNIGIEINSLMDYKYSLGINEILNSRGWHRKKCGFIKKIILNLNNLAIKSLDRNFNFGELVVFTDIYDNIYNDSIDFKINHEILKSFYNLNSAIGLNNKPYYTNMQEKFDVDVDFKQENPYHIFEYYLRYESLINMNKNKIFILKLELNEFKSMIGISNSKYENIQDLKKRVIKNIEDKLLEIYKCKVKIDVKGTRNLGKIERRKYIEISFYSRLSL